MTVKDNTTDHLDTLSQRLLALADAWDAAEVASDNQFDTATIALAGDLLNAAIDIRAGIPELDGLVWNTADLRQWAVSGLPVSDGA